MNSCKSALPLLLTFATCSLSNISVVSASNADTISAAEYGTVINLSGKQRMLTQKMSKEMLMIATSVLKEENLESLEATIALFDRTLNGLEFGDEELNLPPTHSPAIIDQIHRVRELWEPYHSMAKKCLHTNRVSKIEMRSIAQNSVPLLSEMNKVVKLFEEEAASSGLESDPGLAVAINLSGRQRMLTQKMCKEYLLIALGHDAANVTQDLIATTGLFDTTLSGLLDGDAAVGLNPTEDPEIREQLLKVQTMWEPFSEIILKATKPEKDNFVVSDIQILAAENMPLLKEMDKAVKMYELQAAKTD